jgi:hypothetical protein
MFEAPERPGDALAWGEVDHKTNLMPMFTPDGLWFVMDIHNPGACYFMGGDKGAVKIGFSEDVEKRLREIRPHSPIPLRILAATHGGRMREAHYHWKFRRLRLHGEWFRRTPGLMREIGRLNAACPYQPFMPEQPDGLSRNPPGEQ